MKTSLLCVCVLGLTAFSLLFGASNLSVSQAYTALIGQGSPLSVMIMQELRLPRTLLALVIGAGLGASGACLSY